MTTITKGEGMVFTMAGVKPEYFVTVAAALPKVKILDTSRHNHGNGALEPIDFVKVKAAGYTGWCGRASVGDYYVDPWFARDYDAAQAAGLICMAYHVTVPTINAGLQIANFKAALGGRQPVGIVIDMEWNNVPSTPQRVTECNAAHADAFYALDWLPQVVAYTNQNYADKYLLNNLDLPLWVASPGAGGVMNPAPLPSMPRLWSDYLMWQRSWTEAIPGVPDATTDYSEWNGLTTMQDYFDTNSDVPGDDMTDVIARLTRIESKIDQLIAGGGTTPPPPVTPPPAADPTVIITADPRANARFVVGRNGAGKPIMAIYPKDTAPANERIQFASGVLLRVKPGMVQADGGMDYFELTQHTGRGGERLYLRENDADLI